MVLYEGPQTTKNNGQQQMTDKTDTDNNKLRQQITTAMSKATINFLRTNQLGNK